MKNLRCLSILMSMLSVLIGLCVSVNAQSAEDKNKIANISASGSSVRWDVTVPYAGLTMTVSAPDGQVFRKEFKAGSAPEFTLVDKDGNRLPDGHYRYELRLAPEISKEVKKALSESRIKYSDSETRSTGSDDDAAPEREMRKRGMLPSHPLVQSGTFQILRGSVIVAGSTEESQRTGSKMPEQQQQRPMAVRVSDSASVSRHHGLPLGVPVLPDQVIPDDLIVQGSGCFGFDCVNNESFGVDTIRLKENNTRIKFEDTSTSAGFASNDWQLTANDQASGGANQFSIEDVTGAKVPFMIQAGAATNSIFVDSTGRIGLRTSTPEMDVHVNTSNTPVFRLEQNNGGGFTAQTWDVGGNEANFFIRDRTGNSQLSFRIRPGAPTSSLDISSEGKIGIRTGTATGTLTVKQVEDSFTGGLHMRRSNLSNATWALVTGSDNNFYFGFANNASRGDEASDFTVQPLVLTNSGRVGIGTATPDQLFSVNGEASKAGGGSWLAFSDERLKNIKGRFTSGLSALMQLQPLRYVYKSNNALGLPSDEVHVGFGAQALQKVIPEAVTSTESGYLMVNNDPIIWTMLNAIKEQQNAIKAQEKEIEQLKAQIRQLQPRAGNRARNRRR